MSPSVSPLSILDSKRLLTASLVFMLTSCAQQESQSHFNQVRHALSESHQQIIPSNTNAQSVDVELLYQQSLRPRSAVQIFMAQSPRVKEALSQLDEADAQELQASLIGNPRLSLSLLKATDSGHWLWDASLLQPFFDLLSRKNRQKIAAQEAQLIELQVLSQLQQMIAEFQVDYFKALTAKQSLLIAQIQLEASDARTSLAQAIYKAGNISELDYLDHLAEFQKEQLSFSAQSLEATLANHRLNLWFASDKPFQLPDTFPDISSVSWDAAQLKKMAYAQNLELKIVRLQKTSIDNQIIQIKKEYGLSNIDLGVAAKQEADGTKAVGITAEVPLGLFDQGKAKVKVLYAKSNALLAKQKNTELKLGYDIDQCLLRMKSAKENLLLLGQTKTTTERRLAIAQQQMNFMLKNPFELIELKYQLLNIDQTLNREQLAYWEAYSELEATPGKSLVLVDDSSEKNLEIKK